MKQNNFAHAVEKFCQAVSLRPDYPRYLLNLANAEIKLGNKQEALVTLKRVADMGIVFRYENDPDLQSVSSLTEYKEMAKQVSENRKPVTQSEQQTVIQEKGLIAEGIAYDETSKAFFLGSVRKRKILKLDQHGNVSEFSKQSDSLFGAFGMKVDPQRSHLWVCSSVVPEMEGFNEQLKGRASVLKYDLKTNTMIKRYLLPASTKGNIFGDLTVSPEGDVYITDSQNPEVYVISAVTNKLELFLKSDYFLSPQGIDVIPNKNKLVMSDYSQGIFIIDIKTKEVTLLGTPLGKTFLGMDGIYYDGEGIIGVQNGINPNRIVRIRFNKVLTTVQGMDILEVNNPSFDDPTLGTLVHGVFYYLPNGKWNAIDEKGNMTPEDKLPNHLIFRIKL